MAGSVQAALVRGKVARFTLTDLCGFPQTTNSMYVIEALVEINSTKNMDSGDEIKTRRMTGGIGIYERGRQSLQDFSVDIHFEKMDPGALVMLTGDAAILNAAGTNIVGFTERAGLVPVHAFATELWTDSSGGVCVAGSKLYGYMLYPCLEQGYLTIDNITDKEVTGTIHANSRGGPSWGKGPYGTASDGSSVRGPIADASGNPGRLLAAVDPAEHRHFELTTIAPPTPQVAAGPSSIVLPTVY